jgi:hypothetical protein
MVVSFFLRLSAELASAKTGIADQTLCFSRHLVKLLLHEGSTVKTSPRFAK